MEIKKINLNRFQSYDKETAKNYFGIRIKNKIFYYLITDPNNKKTTYENYSNNFYSGFDLNSKAILFSTKGISIFNENLENEKLIILNKNYNHKLENLNHFYNLKLNNNSKFKSLKEKKSKELEKLLFKLV